MNLKVQKFPEVVRHIVEAHSYRGVPFRGGRVVIINTILRWRFACPIGKLPSPACIQTGTWFAN